MAIRRQFFEYSQVVPAASTVTDGTVIDIFVNLTKATTTKATEFVVINDFGASPKAHQVADVTAKDATNNGFFTQIRIATTGYFVLPDGIQALGVHSWSTPYPPQTDYQGHIFDLTPDIYVLPGQNWNVLLTVDGDITHATIDEIFRAYVQYTLYDNADSQFAVELFRNSISVTPENVEWYKRELVQAGA